MVPKVLVSKCDQCVGGADMACVRVCPTVALKVVDLDLPRTDPERMMAAHARYKEEAEVAMRRDRRRRPAAAHQKVEA